MSFQSIRRILPSAVEQAGIKRQIDAVRVLEVAERTLRTLWGDERASLVAFVSFHEGVLKLTSSSPVVVQEIKRIKPSFQNDINRALGEKAVRALNVFHA